ncbi:hypothetical protein KPL47_09835 [Clostridium estertheticum]|uniref:hypothetical protein n=1 Tax=Clostridium estertheticum TaxID=238834 RepID=UPI001C0D9878|nr:hypothetical protein [Clostridium estertheticum]MBU3176672.1 hypothetical protein [Clostridium estertheticum]
MKKIFDLFNRVINTLTESSQLNDNKMRLQEEIEHYKEVYEYAQKELDDLVERKRHIEIKILYLLQACALVITLFTALIGYIINDDFMYIKFSSYLVVVFYIAIALSVICLVISLDDTLASWKFTKSLFLIIYKTNMDKELKEVYEDGETIGLHKEAPTSKLLLEVDINEIGKRSYYRRIIKSFIRSTMTSRTLLLCKNMYFTFALKLFVTSIILVIALGILVA